jgi:glycosyltransferase involved in cell wall biosynthesis
MARICVIRQFFFPLDPRVRREVQALVSAGHEVDVICVKRSGEPYREQCHGARVYRLPFRHSRGGVLSYMAEYVSFLLGSMLLAGALHVRRAYDIVQVHSVPDILVFAALIPRLLGARVLLDLHECMPEFFTTKFGANMRHPGVRVLGWLEQASIRFAGRVMTCTEQMRDTFVRRGAPREKIDLVMNSSDEDAWSLSRCPSLTRAAGSFRLICHGSVEQDYGLDIVIRAVSHLKDEIPELEFEVCGEGTCIPDLRRLAAELGIEDRIHFTGRFLPLDELIARVASADAGVIAMRRDAFRDLTHCNKMFDFITLRVPVIISRTRAVEAYFPDTCFQFFTSGDDVDLARAIRELYQDPGSSARMVEEAARVNEAYRWPRQREHYLAIIQDILPGPRKAMATPEGPYPQASEREQHQEVGLAGRARS